jgi:hypothetical protein
MTTTSTTDLQGILAAKKAELNGQPQMQQVDPEAEYMPPPVADPQTGEIVPVAAADVSPTDQGRAPALPAAATAPVDPIVSYPEIPPKVVGGLPYIREYVKLARTIDQTEMVPAAFRGRYDAITAAFMRGYELGLGPMQALDSFNVIEGKVGLSAEAMRALIMQAGHLFVLSEEPGVAYVTCRRSDWPQSMPSAVYRYDMEDARIARLLGPTKSGKPSAWDKNPRAMLAARATSGAGRAYFADVLAGMSYTPEEIRDFSGPEQEAPPSQPTPAVSESTPAPVALVETEPESSTSSTEAAPSTESSVTETPKRPRGRPRKATTPPVDAPGPSASEPPPSAPESTPTTAQPMLGPPETTSLNEPTDAPGVQRQMLSALTAIIAGLPTVQQPLCRTFIRQHFPDGHAELGQEDIQKCIDIAAGWPDSMAQYPVPQPAENPF